jgi:hypothetical protein
MQITIDTNEELTETDQKILMLVLGEGLTTAVAEAESDPEPAKPAAKKTTAAAKKTAPKPEPAAEEPVEDDEDLIGDDAGDEDDSEFADLDDETLLELAVKKATEMVAGGEAAKVREALDAAGAGRVRELNTENVRAFFQALS